MKIYNEEKTEELNLDDLNMELGYLKEDVLIHHISAQPLIEEQGHYETIAEYPNGGKDVEWIVDVEGQPAIEEHDEQEDILVFIEYSERDLTIRSIGELKAHLQATDYQAIKFAEGELSAEDYASMKEQRRQWRVQINQLEQQLED